MIVRTWKAEATKTNAKHYLEHFTNKVHPQLTKIQGFKKTFVLQRDIGDQVELLVMTFWDSIEDVKKFAGVNFSQAVVETDAQAVLDSYDLTVKHYEQIFG
jgi:heme-degrading monooxygenase HmoA